jgi:hypothetical protein
VQKTLQGCAKFSFSLPHFISLSASCIKASTIDCNWSKLVDHIKIKSHFFYICIQWGIPVLYKSYNNCESIKIIYFTYYCNVLHDNSIPFFTTMQQHKSKWYCISIIMNSILSREWWFMNYCNVLHGNSISFFITMKQNNKNTWHCISIIISLLLTRVFIIHFWMWCPQPNARTGN